MIDWLISFFVDAPLGEAVRKRIGMKGILLIGLALAFVIIGLIWFF